MSYQPLPKPKKVLWLVASQKKQRVVIISRIRFWTSHWDVTAGKSRRCAGDACQLCAAGLPQQIRYVCLVVDQLGSQRLLEFRERHYAVLETMRCQPRGELGTVIVIQKSGEAKNSPVEIKAVGQEQVIEQEISRLVESLGLPPKFLTDEQPTQPLQKENPLFEETESDLLGFKVLN